jgi:hypothetical protein
MIFDIIPLHGVERRCHAWAKSPQLRLALAPHSVAVAERYRGPLKGEPECMSLVRSATPPEEGLPAWQY